MIRTLDGNSKDYYKYLAKFLNSEKGKYFAFEVFTQLLSEIQIDKKGNVVGFKINTDKLIVYEEPYEK